MIIESIFDKPYKVFEEDGARHSFYKARINAVADLRLDLVEGENAPENLRNKFKVYILVADKMYCLMNWEALSDKSIKHRVDEIKQWWYEDQ